MIRVWDARNGHVLFEGLVGEDITAGDLRHWPSLHNWRVSGVPDETNVQSLESWSLHAEESGDDLMWRILCQDSQGVLRRVSHVSQADPASKVLCVLNVHDVDFAESKVFSCLEELWFHQCKLRALPLDALHRVPHLKSLVCCFDKLTHVSADHFSQLSAASFLVKLDLSFNKLSHIDVTPLTLLQQLRLNGNILTSAPHGLHHLTQLRVLQMGSNFLSSFPDDVMSALVQLEELNLSNNKMTQLPSSLWTLTQMTKLSLAYNSLECIPEDISLLHRLHSLDLNSVHLKRLPLSMQHLTCLCDLDLSSNELDADIPGLFALLQNPKNVLKNLQLCQNNMSSGRKLVEALSNSGVTHLNLGLNAWDDSTWQHLGLMLSREKYLLQLNVVSSRLSASRVVSLCDGLKHNRSLRQLIMSWGQLGDAGAVVVANMLKANQGHLCELYVYNCSIREAGASVLLSACDHLSFLNLSGNEIDQGGCDELCNLLRRSSHLKELESSWQHLKPLQRASLAWAVEESFSLVRGRIVLEDESLQPKIQAVMNRNKAMHLRVRRCCQVLLAVHRFRASGLGKDCGGLLGKALLNTMTDGHAWSTEAKEPPSKSRKLI